jgi:hypothetical protein
MWLAALTLLPSTPSSAAQSFSNPKSAGRHLVYLRKLHQSESRLVYLRYDVHQVHQRHNLPNSALNRVPEVVLSARLKHIFAVAGLGVRATAYDRLGRFQAVCFNHGIAPVEELFIKYLFVCCPALWWNYLTLSLVE